MKILTASDKATGGRIPGKQYYDLAVITPDLMAFQRSLGRNLPWEGGEMGFGH